MYLLETVKGKGVTVGLVDSMSVGKHCGRPYFNKIYQEDFHLRREERYEVIGKSITINRYIVLWYVLLPSREILKDGVRS